MMPGEARDSTTLDIRQRGPSCTSGFAAVNLLFPTVFVMQFTHDLAPARVVFGRGSAASLTTEIARLGRRRAVLVAPADSPPPIASVVTDVEKHTVARIREVREHVPVETAAAATRIAEDARGDLLIAVGGGSTIGTAKAVARRTGIPVLAVPTTFAGSEMTPIWGETSGTTKTTGRDERVRPRTVIYDPDLSASMPPALAAASGLNALAHCAEAVYDPGCSPLVRLAALEGAAALGEALPTRAHDPGDGEAHDRALYGAWLGGLVLGNATMGLHHKLCHVLGGLQRLPHAPLHAALLPYVLAFNEAAAPTELSRLARALGGTDAAGAAWDLGRRVGVAGALTDIGFAPSLIKDAVDAVLAAPPPGPRPVDENAILHLLERAVEGARPEPPNQRKS
jgi:maleylacetate reductase